jgi:hypothetical protein
MGCVRLVATFAEEQLDTGGCELFDAAGKSGMGGLGGVEERQNGKRNPQADGFGE